VRSLPQLEQLEDRLTPAVLSDNGAGTLAIALGANENLSITANASTYTLTSNQNFTNGGVSNVVDFSDFGNTSLTLQASGIARYSTLINVTDASGANANATVTFSDSGINNYTNNFTINLSNAAAGQITFNGNSNFGSFNLNATTTSDILVSVTSVSSTSGVIALTAARSITVSGESTISTVDGGITLSANQQASQTHGSFTGIDIDTAAIETSGTGNITLLGRGGDMGSNNGVLITGAFVQSSASGASAGTVTITGSVGGDSNNYGVRISDNFSAVVSDSGDIDITGTCTSTGSTNAGVYVADSGFVESSGTGPDAANITIVGTTTSGADDNAGVYFFGEEAATGVSAVDGNISITGNGSGTGQSCDGIRVQDLGTAITTGTGNISLIGTASTQGGTGFGVTVTDFFGGGVGGSVQAQGNGSVTLTGVSATEAGISIISSTVGYATSAAPVTLIADSIAIDAASTVETDASGVVTIREKTPGQGINIGSAGSSSVLGLPLAELNQISTGTLQIGDDQSGDLTISTALTIPASTSLVLNSGSIVTQSAALNVSDLTVEAKSGITLTNANNAIGALDALNTRTGNINLIDSTALSITNLVQLGTGSVNVSSAGSNTALTVNGYVGGAGGSVTLEATGNLTVATNQTIDVSGGVLTLGADLTAAGAGDDGVGTLTINAGAAVYGANITLRGADENIDSTATVGSAGGTTTFVDTPAGLGQPFAETFDSNGNLYVISSANNVALYKVTPAGVVSTLVNSGLNQPYGLARDASGNFYISNPGAGTISEFDSQGNPLNTFGSVGPGRPFDMAFDSSGNLYVADFDGSEVSKYAPNGTPINADYIVEPSNSGTTGLAFDSHGNLYVANAVNGTVSEYDSSGNLINAAFYTDPSGNGVHDLTFDSSDNLYITNQNTGQVIKVTPSGVATTFLASGLDSPTGIALDAGGNVYVSNYNGNTITKSLPVTTQVTIQSSVESRPMEIGGLNNAAVAGVNLTVSELARIITASTGTITVGDPNQTGNITLSIAQPATTAGASLVVVQSGSGQIILDDFSGGFASLDGHGGAVSLTSGTGGIVEAATNTVSFPDIQNASTVSLTSAGTLGFDAHPLQLASTVLTTDTSAADTSQFLSAFSTVTAESLNAGSNTTTLEAGTFNAGNATVFNTNSALVVKSVFDLNGYSNSIGPLTGNGSITDSGAAATLNVSGGSFSGTLEDGSGALSLGKVGTGTLTLTGTNTYTGSSTVSAGTLRVDGSLAGGSAVGVQSGATLDGTGTVNGSVTVQSGGNLSPGHSPGIINTGNLSLNSGANFNVELNGTTAGTLYDQVDAAGSVNLDADSGVGANLNLSLGYAPSLGDQFVIIKNNGGSAISGTFDGLSQGALMSAFFASTIYTLSVDYAGGSGHDVVLTIVGTTTTGIDAPAITYGSDGKVTVTVSSSSGTPTGNVSLSVDGGPDIVQVLNSGSSIFTLPGLNAGPHTLVASYAAQNGFAASSNNNGSISVSKYAFSVDIGNDSQFYGDPADLATDLPATIDTGINGETLGITYASSGDTTTAHVGGYDITGSLSDGSGLASNYDVTVNKGTLTVQKHAISYTIENDTQTFGMPANLAADLPPTINTGVNGETLSISYSSNGDTALAPDGDYDITGNLSDGTGLLSDYAVTLTNGTLTVAPLNVTLIGAEPTDELVQPVVGQAFTVTVGSFVPNFEATASDFTATIDWGDNTSSAGVITPNSSGGFDVSGTHTYTTEETVPVEFTVTHTASNTIYTTDSGYAVVFTGSQTSAMQNADFAFIPPGGGSATAATTNISGTLTLPAGTRTPGTVSVVEFQISPAVPPIPQSVIQSAFPDGTTVKTNFYDIRVTGAVPGATLVVTFKYDSTGITNPIVYFFDPTTGTPQPVHGSTHIPNSYVVDPVAHTVRIIFDSTSFPTIFNLKKTVLTVAVAAPVPSPPAPSTTLTPATALAATQGQGSATDAGSGNGVTLSFQSSSKLTVSVNAAQDSARAPVSGSANEKQDDEDQDENPDGKDPAKKKGDKAKKPDDKSKPTTDKSKPKVDKGKKPGKTDMRPTTETAMPDVPDQPKPREETVPDRSSDEQQPEKMEELETDSVDAYFAWSVAALGFAATPLTSRQDSNRRLRKLVL
jgi:autotransporter-associated beta strand protein